VNTNNPDDVVIKCPYCEMRIDSRDLEEHFNYVHLINPEPSNENVPSKKMISLHNFFTFDGEDFDITDDVIEATKAETNKNKAYLHVIPSHPVEETHIFEDIKKIPGKRPNTGSKIIHPKPYYPVNCPICQEHTIYSLLFDHVSKAHEDKNPKIVLAEFNREYDRILKSPSNPPRIAPRSDAGIQNNHPPGNRKGNLNIQFIEENKPVPINKLRLPSDIVLFLLKSNITTISQLINALKNGSFKYNKQNEIANLAIITQAISLYVSKKQSPSGNKKIQGFMTTESLDVREANQEPASIIATGPRSRTKGQSNPIVDHLFEKPSIPEETGIDKVKISVLGFPPRIKNVLSRNNILTIGQLNRAVHEGSIGNIRQIGVNSLQLIKERLASYPSIPKKEPEQENPSVLTSLHGIHEKLGSILGDQDPIDVLGFPTRIYTVLLRNNVYTIGLLKQAIANESIGDFRNLGKESLRLIARAIIDYTPTPKVQIPFIPEVKITWASTIEPFLLDCNTRNLSIFMSCREAQKLTLAQAAKEYHISRARIQQIENNITDKLVGYIKNYRNQALLGEIYFIATGLGEDFSQEKFRSALQVRNLLGEFNSETKKRIPFLIDPFELLIAYLEITSKRINNAEDSNSIGVPILWKLKTNSVRELRSIETISKDAKKKVARKVLFTGGIKLQEAAMEFSVDQGIAKIQLQNMKMTEVNDGWFTYSLYKASKHNYPLRVAGLKMLVACDQLPLNTFCNGLRRYISQSYPGIAPEKVVIYALKKTGFQVENNIVSTTISTRNALSPSEKCFLQLAQETGPIVIFSEIVERFYSKKLSKPAATRILDRSPIVEKIGARLYKIRGIEVMDTDIIKARQRCQGVNRNAKKTYDLDGITSYKVTIKSRGYSWGILMINNLDDLVGSWEIEVDDHHCGEATVGDNYIRGLSDAFVRLEILMGNQVELTFYRQERKLAIKECSYL
jgi:DNA-directed RNA polymerase alpha subunit/transcriptional regulator with XRE-family HTH domain